MAVVEVGTFMVGAGVDETAVLEADRGAQSGFFYRQPGLVRRTTARGEGGEWLVVTLWRSLADAQSAAERSASDPAASTLLALADPSSLTTRRYETLD